MRGLAVLIAAQPEHKRRPLLDAVFFDGSLTELEAEIRDVERAYRKAHQKSQDFKYYSALSVWLRGPQAAADFKGHVNRQLASLLWLPSQAKPEAVQSRAQGWLSAQTGGKLRGLPLLDGPGQAVVVSALHMVSTLSYRSELGNDTFHSKSGDQRGSFIRVVKRCKSCGSLTAPNVEGEAVGVKGADAVALFEIAYNEAPAPHYCRHVWWDFKFGNVAHFRAPRVSLTSALSLLAAPGTGSLFLPFLRDGLDSKATPANGFVLVTAAKLSFGEWPIGLNDPPEPHGGTLTEYDVLITGDTTFNRPFSILVEDFASDAIFYTAFVRDIGGSKP